MEKCNVYFDCELRVDERLVRDCVNYLSLFNLEKWNRSSCLLLLTEMADQNIKPRTPNRRINASLVPAPWNVYHTSALSGVARVKFKICKCSSQPPKPCGCFAKDQRPSALSRTQTFQYVMTELILKHVNVQSSRPKPVDVSRRTSSPAISAEPKSSNVSLLEDRSDN